MARVSGDKVLLLWRALPPDLTRIGG